MKWKQDRFRVSLDEKTRSVHGKFNHITVNFDSIVTKILSRCPIKREGNTQNSQEGLCPKSNKHNRQ